MRLPDTLTLPPPDSGRRRGRRLSARLVQHRRVTAAVVVAVLAVGGVLGGLLVHRSVTAPAASPAARAAQAAGRDFLARYVDADGRVVRRDQGGDTVSEGQAYALLISASVGDRSTFGRVWAWTQSHLHRSDGLLSWHWADGRVADPTSASDADLDTAWALVLAGRRFADPGYTHDGTALAGDILAHETAATAGGPVLTAGSWAATSTAPYPVNPSYFSPPAFAALARATGDPRWSAVSRTSRSLVADLTAARHLPPDWATVTADGTPGATHAPSGEGPRFGLDAARLPIAYAASCDPVDRQLAARLAPLLDDRQPDQRRAVYDLSGSPQVGYDHPVARVAAAAAAQAAGDRQTAAAALAGAAALDRSSPSYYGAAWVALGRTMLTTDLLGTCPGADGAG